jgi:putative hydrolase of the HAD superfamily
VEGAQNAGWRVAWYAPDGPDGRSTDDRGFVFDDWSTLADRLT